MRTMRKHSTMTLVQEIQILLKSCLLDHSNLDTSWLFWRRKELPPIIHKNRVWKWLLKCSQISTSHIKYHSNLSNNRNSQVHRNRFWRPIRNPKKMRKRIKRNLKERREVLLKNFHKFLSNMNTFVEDARETRGDIKIFNPSINTSISTTIKKLLKVHPTTFAVLKWIRRYRQIEVIWGKGNKWMKIASEITRKNCTP